MELYKKTESLFEKLSGKTFPLLGNSLVFLTALCLTLFWMLQHDWHAISLTDGIRDVMLFITFLSFFIIQRTFSHFSMALHLKLNELVAAHENARNNILKAEEKTAEEIAEMSKDFDRIIEEEQKETTKN